LRRQPAQEKPLKASSNQRDKWPWTRGPKKNTYDLKKREELREAAFLAGRFSTKKRESKTIIWFSAVPSNAPKSEKRNESIEMIMEIEAMPFDLLNRSPLFSIQPQFLWTRRSNVTASCDRVRFKKRFDFAIR
jgi:hypothetical protein